MNITETHQIKPNHKLYSICDELCFKSKNLYNAALYQFRQSYFDKEKSVLSWKDINKMFLVPIILVCQSLGILFIICFVEREVLFVRL